MQNLSIAAWALPENTKQQRMCALDVQVQTFQHYSLGTCKLQNDKVCMPKKYRCKHLSITAWAYAKLQNNKECVPQMYRHKPFKHYSQAHA